MCRAGVAVISVIMAGACSGTSVKDTDTDSSAAVSGMSAKTGVSEDSSDNGLPTVMDFYATWCGPCKSIAPVFEMLKEKYGDKVNFVSVDVDIDSAAARKYSVEAMPTFVFLDADGNEIHRIVGADPQALSSAVGELAR